MRCRNGTLSAPLTAAPRAFKTVIKRRQQTYYDQLAAAEARADCSSFIEFMQKAIEDSLLEAIRLGQGAETPGKTLGKTPDRIIALLRESSTLSIPEMAASLGKSESAVERVIRKLGKAGRLKRIGPDKGGHWYLSDEPRPKGSR